MLFLGSKCEAVLPRCTVGSRQAEHESQGVDGRGRYGNEVGNSLRSKRDEPMGEEGGCKPEEHIRGGQGLAEG